MDVKIKRISRSAKIPTKKNKTDAGYDIYADNDEVIRIFPHSAQMIHTGICIAAPSGYFGAIFARSGLACTQGIRPSNCVGVVDENYRGEVMVSLRNDSDETVVIVPHERIAQLVFLPYLDINFEEVGELDETERGEGGFGSTGRT